MSEASRPHWEQVHATGAEDGVSWFQETPGPSLALLGSAGLTAGTSLIDVGAGASRLVDALLESGLRDVTVLDLSAHALERARARLGDRANAVSWIACDVTAFVPTRTYDLWHDRAAFHFLTDADARNAYKQALSHAVRPGGQAIIATFADDGPERCSGLPVVRYSPESLAAEFADGWSPAEVLRDEHRTPSGRIQPFTFVRFVRGVSKESR